MKLAMRFFLGPLWIASLALPAFAADPLPSWSDTAPKKAIVAFVERVTKEGSADYVPPAERIATFDQDGCLWAEQPMYAQLAFALDRGLDEAPRRGWVVISMKNDWKRVFPFERL